MEGDRVIDRAIRLTQIQHFLHSNPHGLTSREISELCGVCIRIIQRDLLALQEELKLPLTQNGDRYGLMEGYILPPVSLSLFEALAAYLALRLFLRQTDKHNPHVESALAKMSKTLPAPLSQQIEAGIRSTVGRPLDPRLTEIFERIALAWTTRRQIRINYQSLQSNEVKVWLVEPYFVDMTGVGFSTYVIGHGIREGKEGIITFKLDRIKTAEILDINFEIPADFDPFKLLSSSWGIVWGDETIVKLRFDPAVVRRVKESIWHPSQVIEDLSDGSCIMAVRIGSVIEMTRWILGWGPDVEVLEPTSLRNEFRELAKRWHKVYGNDISSRHDLL